MKNLQHLLKFLIHSPFDFVIVGGFAAVLHGCNQTTRDLDVCLVLSPDEIQLLRQNLKSLNPRHRALKTKPSFLIFPENLTDVKNLYLETDLGVLDIIANVEGVGDYYNVLRNAEEIELYGGHCFLISLDDLIKSNKALGRHRDLIVVDELVAIKKQNS